MSLKANTVHTHAIADITDLQTTLDSHITMMDSVVTSVNVVVGDVQTLPGSLAGKADAGHTHVIADIKVSKQHWKDK